MAHIRYKTLRLWNFGPYQKLITIPLENQGMILLTGKNGHGKTTVFKGLHHIQYPTASMDTWINIHSGKDMRFELDFEKDGVPSMIRQFRACSNPKQFDSISKDNIQLFVNGSLQTPKKDQRLSKKMVQDYLGMSPSEFFGISYLPQQAIHTMLSGTPGEKKEYIAKFFSLELYDQLKDVTSNRRESLQGKLDDLVKEEVEFQLLNQQLSELQDEESVIQKIAEVDKEISDLEGSIKSTRSKKSSLDKAKEELDKRLELNQVIENIGEVEDVGDLEEIRKALQTDLNNLQQEKSAVSQWTSSRESVNNKKNKFKSLSGESHEEYLLEDQVKFYENEKKAWDEAHITIREKQAELSKIKQSSGSCPTCKRPWLTTKNEQEVHSLHIKRLEMGIKGLQVSVPSAQREALELLNKTNGLWVEVSEALKVIGPKPGRGVEKTLVLLNQTESDLNNIQEKFKKSLEVSNIKKQLESLQQVDEDSFGPLGYEKSIRSLNKLIEDSESGRDEFLGQRAVLDKDLKTLRDVKGRSAILNTRLKDLPDIRRKLRILDALLMAFGNKGLKALRIGQILEDVAAHLPKYVSILFGIHDLQVLPGDSDNPFDFKMFRAGKQLPKNQTSGGETQKLSVAALFSMRSLRAARKSTNVLIMDEPFVALDEEARERLLLLLEDFKKDFETIIVTTHEKTVKSSSVWDQIWTAKREGVVATLDTNVRSSVQSGTA